MNLSGLSLRDLEYVVAIADHLSFVRAAEQCRVAQPSLSAQVRKLETWMGLMIFERTTRRVLITPEGRQFVDQARKVLQEARQLFMVARNTALPFGGSLRLAAISTLGPYLFPRILPHLRTDYPELTMVLGEGLTDDLAAKLSEGDLDAVLLSLPQPDRSLSTAAIFDEPFFLACPHGHAAMSKGGPNWDGLRPEERLLLEEGHCLREQALAACSVVDRSNRHGTSLETLKYMVAAGEGCTLVPALAIADKDAVAYSPQPAAGFVRRIALAWRRSDPRDEEFKILASHLRSIIATLDLGVSLPSNNTKDMG